MPLWVESLEGFKFKSDFLNEIKLKFFKSNDKNRRLSIVYGRNGSGKSTIAKCIKNFSEGISYPSAEPLLKDNYPIKDVKISVFNDEYINNNVRLISDSSKGLKPIILFGKQIELEEKIKQGELELAAENEKLERLEQENQKYLSKKGIHSIEAKKEEIHNVLRRRWYDVAVKYRKKNVNIRDSIFDNLTLSESAKALENEEKRSKEFKDATEEYKTLESELNISNQVEIFENISNLPEFNIPAYELKSLCEKTVVANDLTEKEKFIKEKISTAQLVSSKNFIKSGQQVCPTCLRLVNEQARQEALAIIDKILNKEVDNFVHKLQACSANQIEIHDIELWKKIEPSTLDKFIQFLTLANNFIDRHNHIIKAKINSLDTAIYDYPLSEYINIKSNFDKARNNLIQTKYRIVDSARASDQLIKDILIINDRIARCEISELAHDYRKIKAAHDSILLNINQQRNKLYSINKFIKDLRGQQGSIKIAIDKINKLLALVYGNSHRIQLELGSNNNYHLKVRGRHVEPHSLSTGEQNILALTYFFLSIAEEQSVSALYQKPSLIVIDDPISSFDHDVRLGVYSFISSQINELLTGSDKTKILVTTHDNLASFAFYRIFTPNNALFWKLENKELLQIKKAEVGEYENLLISAYEFALDSKQSDIGIDNILRKILEAASTYHFKSGFNKIDFSNKSFRETPPYLLNQFKKLKMTLMLNYESHLQSQIYMDPDWPSSLTQFHEQVRVARIVLCFLYTISKNHIISFIKEKHPDVESVIQAWIKEINY